MDSRICMNTQCGAAATATSEWKKGWPLRSGELAILCNKCGAAYEQLVFCEVFHSMESGWRECTSCGKRLHCGCIVSRFSIELLDRGGVSCTNCAKQSELNSIHDSHKRNIYGLRKANSVGTLHPLVEQSRMGVHIVEETNLLQLGSNAHALGHKHILQLQKEGSSTVAGEIKQEQVLEIGKAHILPKDSYETMAQTNLSISLGPSMDPSHFHGAVVDEKEKASPIFQQALRSRQLLPKPIRSELASFLEPNASMMPQIRVARPPAEGRGKSQLLPRYWPRITDQELQQISGDSNSTIVPLFEKVLSASDAGRIGRLVLPKACAEAYFPPISQPEGLPLNIQDIKGKEWVFQFRFWPNNNSRMYVLEGVTPCIQSMQLQAGDTVTFSRIDPEGKLVMGFRKATNSAPIQGSGDLHLGAVTRHLDSANGGGINWHKLEKHENLTKESLLLQSMLGPDRKRTRNIGSKNKRLLIDSLDVLELKLTWEEVQDLFRPPTGVEPSIVTIEDYDFEEYNEPPVFGKSSIFVLRPTGGQEQWTQCDSCSKWRQLPIQALLPPKWTCADNIWDQSRSSCSAPDELTPREQETLIRLSKELKRQRMVGSDRVAYRHEASGITALPNTATDGDNAGESGPASFGATTKHPRHRPGCSCIVCIQPPSGKGKHKPTCTCNVCMTVKRRFKTLMMRKKKRQSEREAEIVQRIQHASGSREETEADNVSQHLSSLVDSSDNEVRSANGLESNNGTGPLDLNSRPIGVGEASRRGLSRVSMMSLLQVANLPLELYLKQNGLTSLASEQAAASGAIQQEEEEDKREKELSVKEEKQFESADEEEENGNAEAYNHDSTPTKIIEA